ncbi:MAG TPA: hypothetical protein VMU22_02900 [Rhizomicrobium sp.]|nr:hypothetical protein [Rhizomicrobium sp.]
MTAKADIVARLGETAVLLPERIADALAANDRIKLRLSLLQDARAHARSQGAERAADTRQLKELPPNFVSAARLIGNEVLYAPGLSILMAGLAKDLAAMLEPLKQADGERSHGLLARAAALAPPQAADDRIALADIDALASADRHGKDSLHLLVMDVHKAINRLSAETAVETLDGAHVHALSDNDRRAVKAFMRGLNRTAPLAFGHPGLGTTAVRMRDHLTIQNDIGTTDAHVLVVQVTEHDVAVTYTDVHRARAKFFMALFEGRNVSWSPLSERPGEGLSEEVFYLVTGRLTFSDHGTRDGFLEFLGSRIVFLIDWNKARKALQTFVGKNTAIDLLSWAATHDYGHRAFIDLGGTELISAAVQGVAAGRIAYGARLDAALGANECREFLEHVLRDTSLGLTEGRTARLIRDEIRADLARRFETAESSVLTGLVRNLGLARMLTDVISESLSPPITRSQRERLAQRAKLMEGKADRLTLTAREIAARLREAGLLRPVIDEIENATDSLEDCAFLISLIPDGSHLEIPPLAALVDIVMESVSQLVRAVEAASRLPTGQRADAVASLQAIDAVVVAEREADERERDAFAALMANPRSDARDLVLGLEIARGLETATDHLSHAAHALRDRVLEELAA